MGAGSCTSVLNRSERGLAKAESRAYPGLEAVVSPTNATYTDKRGAVPWKIRVRLLKRGRINARESTQQTRL